MWRKGSCWKVRVALVSHSVLPDVLVMAKLFSSISHEDAVSLGR
jgi:hypothetical protein